MAIAVVTRLAVKHGLEAHKREEGQGGGEGAVAVLFPSEGVVVVKRLWSRQSVVGASAALFISVGVQASEVHPAIERLARASESLAGLFVHSSLMMKEVGNELRSCSSTAVWRLSFWEEISAGLLLRAGELERAAILARQVFQRSIQLSERQASLLARQAAASERSVQLHSVRARQFEAFRDSLRHGPLDSIQCETLVGQLEMDEEQVRPHIERGMRMLDMDRQFNATLERMIAEASR